MKFQTLNCSEPAIYLHSCDFVLHYSTVDLQVTITFWDSM